MSNVERAYGALGYRTEPPGAAAFASAGASREYYKLSEALMDDDLAKSGLEWSEMDAIPLGYVSAHWRNELKAYIEGNYMFPYYDLDGNKILDEMNMPLMFRIRGFLSDRAYSDVRRAWHKYTQPGRSTALRWASAPYLHPSIWACGDTGGLVAIAEGEKKARCMTKLLGIPAIGTGGCWNHRALDDARVLHPLIVEALQKLGATTVHLVPDADVHRYDISPAYEERARLLEQAGFEVEIIDLTGSGEGSKIDDLLVAWGDQAVDNYNALPRIDHTQLRQTAAHLASTYSLTPGNGDNPLALNEDNICTLMAHHPSMAGTLRMNTDTMQIELKGRVIDEVVDTVDVLRHYQRQLSMPMLKMNLIERGIAYTAGRNRYSGFQEYLEALEWDGVDRLSTWLTVYCGTPTTPWLAAAGTAYLVGAVGRSYKPGCKMDWMLIARGTQNIGKSSLPTTLYPDPNMVVTVKGKLSTQDMAMLMASGLVINFEELDALNNRELDDLKALVSDTADNVRLPYARTTSKLHRHCVLYGSTNKDELLKPDPSGQRRWCVIEVVQVQFAQLEADRDQLWAQAMHLYRQGSVDFTTSHMPNDAMDDYVIKSDYAPMITKWLRDNAGALPVVQYKGAAVYATHAVPLAVAVLGATPAQLGTGSQLAREFANALRQVGFAKAELVGDLRKAWYLPMSAIGGRAAAKRGKF